MDPNVSPEVLRHLEKQCELLRETHDKMAHELHRLQVEEEMLMRKFYELSNTLGLNKKVPCPLLIQGSAVGGKEGMGERPSNHSTGSSDKEQQQN